MVVALQVMTHIKSAAPAMTGPVSPLRENCPNGLEPAPEREANLDARDVQGGSNPVCVIAILDGRVAKNFVAVGVEAHRPKTNGRH